MGTFLTEIQRAGGKVSCESDGLVRLLPASSKNISYEVAGGGIHSFKVGASVIATIDATGFHGPTVQFSDVKSFGAIGNGVVNDHGAIQAAFDAMEATGGVLYFPVGNYLVDSQRLIYSSTKPIVLMGAGWASKLTWIPPSGVPDDSDTPAGKAYGMVNISGTADAVVSHCPSVVVQDLAFDFGGSRAAGFSEGKRGINVYQADNIYVLRCYLKGGRHEMVGFGNFLYDADTSLRGRNGWVADSTFFDFAQDGINPNVFNAHCLNNLMLQGSTGIEAGVDRFTAIGNDFEDILGTAIKVSSCTHFVIQGNKGKNVAQTPPGGQNEGFVYLIYGGTAEDDEYSVISGNVAENDSVIARAIGITIQRTGTPATVNRKIICSNNILSGFESGMYTNGMKDSLWIGNICVFKTGAGTAFAFDNHVDVTNNTATMNKAVGAWTNKFTDGTPSSQGNHMVGNFDDDGMATMFMSRPDGGGDVYHRYTVGSVTWAVGNDDSDSDKFKISRSATLGGTDAISIDSTPNVTIVQNLGVGSPVFGSQFEVIKNSSGTVAGLVKNSNNTDAAATGRFLVEAGGTSGGDANYGMSINGSTQFTLGIDNSDADKLKLSNSTTLGTNDRLQMLTTGQLIQTAKNAAPTDADLNNEQISFYLDEGGNALKVRVRYSDGTLKTGTVAVS